MSAIQSGANCWVDGYARYAGGSIGQNYRGGAMNATSINPNASEIDDDSDSLTSVISDVEEEGEVETTHEESHSESSVMDVLSTEIEEGSDEMSASDEIVAAVAAHIGIIEAALRQHQVDGIIKFSEDEEDSNQNPNDEASNDSMTADLLQDPALAFAATVPGQDRLGVLALLS